MKGATTTCTDGLGKVSVIKWTTGPTESSEPLWYVVEMTEKEWALEMIRAQPFFSPNATGSGAVIKEG